MASKIPDAPASPWQETPFTKLPNSYLLRLGGPQLTRHEKDVQIVILVETRGATGRKWRTFGRDAAPISAQHVADATGMSVRRAQAAIKGLITKGWLVVVKPAAGRRPRTLAPNPTPPRPRPMFAETLADAPDAATADKSAVTQYLADHEREWREHAVRHGLGETP